MQHGKAVLEGLDAPCTQNKVPVTKGALWTETDGRVCMDSDRYHLRSLRGV
jgi:hypothetical protein